MGMSYNHISMYGVFLRDIQQQEFYTFLAQHGYPLTEAQVDQIDEDGEEETGTIAGFTAEAITENCWSGHGRCLGFRCNGISTKIVEQWNKEFPNVPGEFFKFTQVC